MALAHIAKGRINFNPRSLAGATGILVAAKLPYGIFQSTLPRGSDCCSIALTSYISVFQSTLPRGSD